MEVLQLPWQGDSRTSLCAFYARTIGNSAGDRVPNLIDMTVSPIDIPGIKTLLAKDLKLITIPQAFIPLRSMPVTTQGKLDRKALQGLGNQLDQATWAKFSASKLAQDPVM